MFSPASPPKLCLTSASSPVFCVFTDTSAKTMFDLGKSAHSEFGLLLAWLAMRICAAVPLFLVCPVEIHTGKIRQFSYVQLTALTIYPASLLTPVILDVSRQSCQNLNLLLGVTAFLICLRRDSPKLKFYCNFDSADCHL
jgi:hypothetical protein